VDRVIRLAGKEDLEAILLLEESCFTADRFSRRQWLYLLTRAKAATWIIEGEGRIDASAVQMLPSKSSVSRLYGLAVHPSRRGQGYARELLSQVAEHARTLGYLELGLEVRASNEAARRLYNAAGFRLLKMKQGYYPDGEDACVMRKSLRDPQDPPVFPPR